MGDRSEAGDAKATDTPAARLAAFRARMATVGERPARAPDQRLTLDDLRRLAELSPTPADEKDAFLRSFRERLLAR